MNYFTSITEFCVPKEFTATALLLGSLIQLPSTKNLYSYLPGLSDIFAYNPYFLYVIINMLDDMLKATQKN